MHLISQVKRKKKKKKDDKLKGHGGVSSPTAGPACKPVETSNTIQDSEKTSMSSPSYSNGTPSSQGPST